MLKTLSFYLLLSYTSLWVFDLQISRLIFPLTKGLRHIVEIPPPFFSFFLKKMILATLGGSDMLEQNFLTDGYLHRLFCTPSLKAARPYGWTRLAVVHHGIFHLHSEIGWALSLFA